jgi:antitoxin (DNA-binding transcriptional repressor) of toxin-antitoxin stability system
MDTFSVRDLRERSGDLVRHAEEGRLSIVAKHGHPLFVAVPLDEHLLSEGVATAMACRLFAEQCISLGKAAKLAGLPVERFIAVLGAMGIPAVELAPVELEHDLAVLA